MPSEHLKLANPVWHSLAETHQPFALDWGEARFYQPAYCPFGSLERPDTGAALVSQYAALADAFFVVGPRPALPASVRLQQELVCWQMLLRQPTRWAITEPILALGPEHSDALFQLVALVMPGFFQKRRTSWGNILAFSKMGNWWPRRASACECTGLRR